MHVLLLGGAALQALAAFGCGESTSPGEPEMAAAGTRCSEPQSAIGCNKNNQVGGKCWTGGTINNGVKGVCVGPYVMEKPNAFAPPVNNALCSCKTS
jgi:hypothetical protein